MASAYTFDTQRGMKVTNFAASAGAAGETLLSTDVTTGQTFWIHQADLLCCGTVAGRICDNSVALKRIANTPAVDTTIAQVVAHSRFYDPPLKVQYGGAYNDYTRVYLESTIDGQMRGSIQYTKG
jgi:hypothetical protein